MAVHITGPRASKDGKKSYYLRKGFARDPETGKQDVAAITWHPPVGLKPAEEKRQLTLFAAQWEEHEIEKRKLATQTSGFTDDSAFVDYAKYVNALKSENRVNRRSTVVRYVELLDDIEAAWGALVT